MDLQVLAKKIRGWERTRKAQFESFLEQGLQSFKKEWCHVNIWSFDSAFQSGASDHRSQFDQERDSSGNFSREVENVLVCVFPFGNEEHVCSSESFQNSLDIGYKKGREVFRNFI